MENHASKLCLPLTNEKSYRKTSRHPRTTQNPSNSEDDAHEKTLQSENSVCVKENRLHGDPRTQPTIHRGHEEFLE
jgi:hypothetical protein